MDSHNGDASDVAQQRDTPGAADATMLQPARLTHVHVDPESNAPKINRHKGSKRPKYIARACAECQKRKIKVRSLSLEKPVVLTDNLGSVMTAILSGLAGLVGGGRKSVVKEKKICEISPLIVLKPTIHLVKEVTGSRLSIHFIWAAFC